MVVGLFILCIVLAIVVVLLTVKIILMRQSTEEICTSFAEKMSSDTNTLISISTNDKAIRHLANRINVQLRELRKQRRRFVQGDIELKNVIANISHDLRTPLTAISGYLDLLDHEEKSETVDRYIEIIKNRTEMLKQLTEELFCYSGIVSLMYDPTTELVTVNSVLEESIAAFYTALSERKITPNIQMPEEKVVRNLNRSALSRVFSNLLNNAVKYSDGDLEIILTKSGEIIFTNTASGLNEVQAGKLFDRFYTVETARKSTGLGLAIARTLMEQMNGTISANYEKNRLSLCILLPDV